MWDMNPQFCPICGMVRIVPIMRAPRAKDPDFSGEPLVLAYKCERGHLFAFGDDNPYENPSRRVAIPRSAKPRPKRLCSHASSALDVKM